MLFSGQIVIFGANCYFQGNFFRPPSKMPSRTPMAATISICTKMLFLTNKDKKVNISGKPVKPTNVWEMNPSQSETKKRVFVVSFSWSEKCCPLKVPGDFYNCCEGSALNAWMGTDMIWRSALTQIFVRSVIYSREIPLCFKGNDKQHTWCTYAVQAKAWLAWYCLGTCCHLIQLKELCSSSTDRTWHSRRQKWLQGRLPSDGVLLFWGYQSNELIWK